MGATSTGLCQVGKRLGKGFATTERIGTEKSAHMDMKPNGIVHQGHICQSTSISAVHFRRHLSTVRTCNSLFRGRNSQLYVCTFRKGGSRKEHHVESKVRRTNFVSTEVSNACPHYMPG